MDSESPASPPPAGRLRRFALFGLLALLLIALLAAGGATWLVHSERGLVTASSLAKKISGGRLSITPASGRLTSPLRLQEVLWQDAGLTVRVEDLALDWNPAALFQRRLEITRLTAGAVHLDSPPSKEPPKLPADLRLPLPVSIGEMHIGRLEKGPILLAEEMAGSLESDGIRHRLTGLRARYHQVSLEGEAALQGEKPFGLTARAKAASQWQNHAFTLELQAGGRLEAIDLAGQGSGALQGKVSGVATPFAAQPFQRLQVHLTGIDPAAWIANAPAARLDVDADLLPRLGEEITVSGQFSITNRLPGRLDTYRLPITRLAGRAAWQGETATFSDLQASLMGGGSLAGQGRLVGRQLELDLEGSKLDAAVLHARLRSTRLRGPLHLRAGPDSQSLTADLADAQFRLAANLSRQGDQVDIAKVSLAAGEARLEGSGRLNLKSSYRFEARGRLLHFDPSRFAKLPPARLNALFDTAGTLQPRPVLAVNFDLQDSRFKGQPLTGQGRVDLDWPRVRHTDLKLLAGPNRLEAHGAFGQPGDQLALVIDAPALTPYGIEGDLRGQVQLSGTSAAPAFRGRLQSERLGLPQLGRLHGLQLEGEAGARPADPLHLDLKVSAIDVPDQAGLTREISLLVAGSRARHDLQGTAALAGQRRIALKAAGGLVERSAALLWNGQLTEFALASPDPAQPLRLLAPAPLRLGAEEWAIGPAEVAASEAQVRLVASAARGRLQAEASGRGERLGKIDARLEARLQGAWKLARTSPWEGQLTLAAADIAWVGSLLGPDWRTGGQLQGELRLAGTPASPLIAGQIRGQDMHLRVLSQGLWLEKGKLLADVAENRLRVTTLDFDSALRALPRPLVQSGAEGLSRLASTPGRLQVRGEIEVGAAGLGSGEEKGVLDLHLDRVGVFQLPDQWVAISGNGQLRWRGQSLGVEAKLGVDAGYWELAQSGMPKLSDDVVVLASKANREKIRVPAPRPQLGIDIETDLGPHFYFSGAGLESRLAGSVRLRASGRDLPRASGTIQTVNGRFDAYGQKLTVERGILNFQGFLDNPGLNVRALRKGLPVEAGVEVTGQVKNPVVRLVSDPELPEAEKLSWLVLGHGSEQAGSNDPSILLAAANTILGKESSGGVVQQLQRRFGIEDLGLRQGQISDIGGRPATSRVAGSGFTGSPSTGNQIMTVSKRLSSNAVLSYEQTLGRTENIVKLTVNLTRRLSVVGRTGSDNALDLFYTFSFGH